MSLTDDTAELFDPIDAPEARGLDVLTGRRPYILLVVEDDGNVQFTTKGLDVHGIPAALRELADDLQAQLYDAHIERGRE